VDVREKGTSRKKNSHHVLMRRGKNVADSERERKKGESSFFQEKGANRKSARKKIYLTDINGKGKEGGGVT